MNATKYYVLDTNVLIDYPDIIPNGAECRLSEPSIDFTGAHLVVPTAVIRELSNHKKEMNDRGLACRTVLKRLRTLVESTKSSMKNAYNLGASIPIRGGTEHLDILPVHKDFTSWTPFKPADTDMDGQIILATLTAQLIANRLISFTEDGPTFSKSLCSDPYSCYPIMDEEFSIPSSDSVILLTNDNGLAIRAHARGICTSRFSYKLPAPYTGRRDLIVPPEMFEQFFLDGYLEKDSFGAYLPDEAPLVANEYIVMYPENDEWPGSFDIETDGAIYYQNIGRYNAKSKVIERLKNLSDFPTSIRNPGQAIYADALMDSDVSVIICTGPAGSGKTYMATIYAYNACMNGEYNGISVVPCHVQDDGVGYLPGDLDEKLDPNVQPIKNALRNYLMATKKDVRKAYEKLKKYGAIDKECKKAHEDCSQDNEKPQKSLKARLEDNANLIYDNWFGKPIPIAYARGRDFSHEIAFYDEFQDQSRREADTLLKRIGEDGKIIITGDIEQIHSAYLDRDNNGLTYARDLLKDNPYVAQVTFLPNEVVRHPLVRAIVEKQTH